MVPVNKPGGARNAPASDAFAPTMGDARRPDCAALGPALTPCWKPSHAGGETRVALADSLVTAFVACARRPPTRRWAVHRPASRAR
jgi:hypothetical protein